MPRFIQNRLFARDSLSSSRCITSSAKPFRPKPRNRRLNVVTIVTTPKSDGCSNLAKTTTDAIWTANVLVDPAIAAPAPRTADRRSSSPVAIGVKCTVGLKGFHVLSWLSSKRLALTSQAPRFSWAGLDAIMHKCVTSANSTTSCPEAVLETGAPLAFAPRRRLELESRLWHSRTR